MQEKPFIQHAIAWVKKKPVTGLKVKADGFEEPKVFLNQRTKEEVQPDISYIAPGGAKHYTEIALKNDDPQGLITRWKLLSLMASMKNGKLHLLAPKGHKMFTQNLVRKYNINALIYSI